MKQSNNWEEQVEETLNSLNGIQRAASNPFLFTKVKARLLENKSQWEKVFNFISRPAVAFSVLTLFLSINVLVVSQRSELQNVLNSVSGESEISFEPGYANTNYSLMDANSLDR